MAKNIDKQLEALSSSPNELALRAQQRTDAGPHKSSKQNRRKQRRQERDELRRQEDR